MSKSDLTIFNNHGWYYVSINYLNNMDKTNRYYSNNTLSTWISSTINRSNEMKKFKLYSISDYNSECHSYYDKGNDRFIPISSLIKCIGSCQLSSDLTYHYNKYLTDRNRMARSLMEQTNEYIRDNRSEDDFDSMRKAIFKSVTIIELSLLSSLFNLTVEPLRLN